MYAVIKTGGKQYLVESGQKLKIEKLAAPDGGEPRSPRFAGEAGRGRDAKEGEKIVFDEVLLVFDDKKIYPVRSKSPEATATSNGIEVGTPLIKGAKVEAKVLKQGRARKVIVFRYHSKTRYRKKKGHRQPFTEIEITKIAA